MAERSDCFTCTNTAQGITAPFRERVLVTEHWRLAHAFGTTLPGWLVLMPTAHVESLHDLTADAAAELGGLLRDVTTGLQDALGCRKTYVALFAEAEGFSHLHFHIIPRMADQPAEHRGPGIFAALGHRPADSVSPSDMDQLAVRIAARIPPGEGREPAASGNR